MKKDDLNPDDSLTLGKKWDVSGEPKGLKDEDSLAQMGVRKPVKSVETDLGSGDTTPSTGEHGLG